MTLPSSAPARRHATLTKGTVPDAVATSPLKDRLRSQGGARPRTEPRMQPGNVVVRLFPDGPPTPLMTQSQPQPQVMGLEMQCYDSVQLASESLLDPHRVNPDEDK